MFIAQNFFKRVPPFGLFMAAFLLGIQGATGILLTFYYEPSARPAVNAHGELLALVEITRTTTHTTTGTTLEKSSGNAPRHFERGDLLAVPLTGSNPPTVSLLADTLHSANRSASRIITTPQNKPLRPSPAFISTEIMLAGVPHGRIVRGVHRWSAHFLIAGVILCLCSGLLTQAYRLVPVRVWGISVVGAALLLASGWTGYTLPWNVRSLAATEIVLSLLERSFSFVGVGLVAVVRGAPSVQPETLTRLFALHAVVLPALMIAGFVAVIIILALTTTTKNPQDQQNQYNQQILQRPSVLVFTKWFGENFLGCALAAALVILGLVALALFAPDARSAVERLPADLSAPMFTPHGIKPEWYFFAPFALFALLPSWLAATVVGLVVVYLLCVPWIDGVSSRATGVFGMVCTAVNVALVFAFVALTVAGMFL